MGLSTPMILNAIFSGALASGSASKGKLVSGQGSYEDRFIDSSWIKPEFKNHPIFWDKKRFWKKLSLHLMEL